MPMQENNYRKLPQMSNFGQPWKGKQHLKVDTTRLSLELITICQNTVAL